MQAHQNDSFRKRKKGTKRSEDLQARELYDLFKDYNKTKFSPLFKENVGEAWENIRQWRDKNEDNEMLLKKAVSYRNINKEMPLHFILKRNPPMDIMELLLKYAPDSVKIKDRHGCFPLLIACSHGASLDVIEALLTAFPIAARETSRYNFPLHAALSSKASFEVIKLLVDEFPMGAELENDLGELPLHVACKTASLDTIKYLANAYPAGLQESGAPADGLPLHVALSSGASPNVIKFLVDAYPQGVREFRNDERFQGYNTEPPHHIACDMKEGSLEVLSILAECYPEGMRSSDDRGGRTFDRYAAKIDDNGMLPLHHACKMGYSLHLIRSLIRVFPNGCMMKDDSGLIPLHHVCKNANVNNIQALKVLLDASPESFAVTSNDGESPLQFLRIVASQRDEKGMFLLHRLALCSNEDTDEDTLRLLFDANPDAIASPDIFLMLPIHHAVLNQATSLEMLMQLIKLNPESLSFIV